MLELVLLELSNYPLICSDNPRTIFWRINGLWLAQTVLYAIQALLAYFLMLAVMTYNVGFLIVVVLGLAFGFLFISPLRTGSQFAHIGHGPACLV